MTSTTRTFTPLKIGSIEVSSRIAMAPLTRYRASAEHIHQDLGKTYYAQRASPVPGTLLITEGTIISARAGNQHNVPGIYTQEQIDAWKVIVDEVHKAGSHIYLQLWALGRAAEPEVLTRETGLSLKSSSAVPMEPGGDIPEELSEEEILGLIADFGRAASAAVHQAGFDGVEIHAANMSDLTTNTMDIADGIFTSRDTCNQRSDKWGGSIENRSRFALAVARTVVDAVGKEKVGLRLSPWSSFQGMKMDDPVSQFSHLITELRAFELSYLHLVESRIAGSTDCEDESADANKFAIDIWGNTSPILLAGGFKPDSARKTVDEVYKDRDVVIMFGRYFISNPDLVYRIKSGIELTNYDRSSFYLTEDPHGYTDYAYCTEYNGQIKI
ncbi:NADH:flavin oxidoreductase/NADH oxidase family protein [Aureobasidium subglaciale]|nr:NADH:flavin oxidoreductase/NADH oxidase family protein [Aureobasidium subglaciale]KAI5219091.1 NADH:flavin oxidoreductase/NADH oxidase family protein [Aureobasidium subglaciale]KAI5233086.1 NADH:flavin oxidoreductase/NADH oxidase family protein [Aureobasidium subglaciale]KAI5260046.1 NADH:flavin oxidoreductase/NADH oxidase family protein [Aureobasidium subglaciale]